MNRFAAPDVSDRLMLALAPPSQVAVQMAREAEQVRAAFSLTARARSHDQLSLVLHGLGDHAGLRRDIVATTAEAVACVAPQDPIALCFDRAESRMTASGRLDLVLKSSAPSAPLEAFQKALGRALARGGLGRLVDRRFEPHMVVMENVKGGLDAPIAPIDWTVTSFSLLHVLLGRSLQVPLRRWPLGPAPADAQVAV